MALAVMLPIAEPGIPITPYELAIDPARFAGAIGFVANSQPGSADFLTSLAPHVIERLPGGQASFVDKGETPAGSAQRLDDATLKRLVGEYSAAVLAYGHCGSCTSATVRDAVAMARLGLPVVATVIPRFQEEAAQVARAAGMPDVPVLVLPGAMTQLSVGERAEVAAQVADQVVALLVGKS